MGAAAEPVLLEYVTTEGCRDCAELRLLLQRVLPDHPAIEAREVGATTARGLELSVERGILSFPIIVLDGETLALERIEESDLRGALARRDGSVA